MNNNEINKQLQELKAERDLLLRQLVVLDGEDVTVQVTQEQFEEYNKLKAENKHLNDLLDSVLKEKEQLEVENEQLYREKKQLQKSQYCVAYEKDCHLVCKQNNCKIKNYHILQRCLDEIEEYCKEQNLKYDTTACDILGKIEEINANE